ncbi:BadF/BadG/BcrA/BcrD ATPase family protein [uncultured Lactobacillus sp.]|uniref:BadF/BadG/BcrA/BcrD ATPase family protein n=1 Tax=uncultured Lactobacillus sp. TaxID=153152 RepID=UPI002634EB2A|nr:BadF/BadG/BcrA/BcrD ATPase family protein [uncultured Lactobacillus sp.]
MAYRIGIDSGGTHVVASLYDENKHLIASSTKGSGNILLNPEQTVKNILASIENVLPNKEINCSLILAGIAGLETISDPQPYLDKITTSLKNICNNVHFISDAKLALISNLKGQDGFLAIAGTGSIVYGKQNNRYLRSGGWGYLLGDYASGYRISQEALSSALIVYDEGEKFSFTQEIFDFFKVASYEELVAKYYKLTRPEIAKFATVVDKLAISGNIDAVLILKHQASLLAHEITSLINRYQDNITQNLALSGSVLKNSSIVQTEVISLVQRSYPEMKIIMSDENNNSAVNYYQN